MRYGGFNGKIYAGTLNVPFVTTEKPSWFANEEEPVKERRPSVGVN